MSIFFSVNVWGSKMSLYKNLKRARIRMGQSQLEVAKNVGISNTALSNYETGYREPDLETLKQLARYYDVSLDELADLSGMGQSTIFDLWTISKNRQLNFRGTTYQLKESQKQVLRRQLTAVFEKFDK